MDKKTNGQKTYKRAIKLSIIQEYLTSGASQLELMRKHKIGTSNFTSVWLNSFNIELYQLGFKQELKDKRKVNSDVTNNFKLLEILRKNKTKITLPIFSKQARYKIVEEYLSTSQSQSQISKKYKIKWRNNICNWIESIEKDLSSKETNKKSPLNLKESNILSLTKVYISNKKPIRSFTDTFKQNILKEYKVRMISQKELSKKYNISMGQISRWLNEQSLQKGEKKSLILNNNLESLMIKDKIIETVSDTPLLKLDEEAIKVRSLKLEIAKLKEETDQKSKDLEYEQLKSIAYSKLIDIAEEELKISIRKK